MKYLRVKMPDLSEWDIPACIIAKDRAIYYAKKDTGKTSGAEYVEKFCNEYEFAMCDSYELMDWASNNMNWSDVEHHAIEYSKGNCDYQEGLVNGDKRIVEDEST